jgi:hypothetical protein
MGMVATQRERLALRLCFGLSVTYRTDAVRATELRAMCFANHLAFTAVLGAEQNQERERASHITAETSYNAHLWSLLISGDNGPDKFAVLPSVIPQSSSASGVTVPASGERHHRGLACQLIAVCRAFDVAVMIACPHAETIPRRRRRQEDAADHDAILFQHVVIVVASLASVG